MKYNCHTLLTNGKSWWINGKFDPDFNYEVVTSIDVEIRRTWKTKGKIPLEPPFWMIVGDLCNSEDNLIVKIEDGRNNISRTWIGLEKARFRMGYNHMYVDGIQFRTNDTIITVVDLTKL